MSAVRPFVATVLVALICAPTAAAEPPTPAGVWGCTSTPLAVHFDGLPDVISIAARANAGAGAGCETGFGQLSDLGDSLEPNVAVTALTARTNQGGSPDAPHQQTPGALAEIAGVRIAQGSFSNVLSVGVARSTVDGVCSAGGSPEFTTGGFVTDIKINRGPVPIDSTALDQVVDVSDRIPGTIATLRINEIVSTPTASGSALTRNAVHLTVLDALDDSPLLDVAVAQATASFEGTPCVDLSPEVQIVDSAINRVVKATIRAKGDHTLVRCAVTVDDGSEVTVVGELSGVDPRVCTAKLPKSLVATGSYSRSVLGTDDAGLTGSQALSSPQLTIVTPTAAAPTADGRSIRAVVTPAPGRPDEGVAISSCKIKATPAAGGTPTTTSGALSADALPVCSATIPAAMRHGDYDFVVEATDANGDAGSSSSTRLTLAGTVGEHSVVNAVSTVNRKLLADVEVTDPATIASCSMTISGQTEEGEIAAAVPVEIDGTYTASVPPTTGTCTADVPSSVAPGTYEVTARAIDDEGDIAADTDALTIDRPTVATPTAEDRVISAAVTAARGPIAIRSCTVTITPVDGTADDATTVTGTYTAADPASSGTCSATAPGELRDGDYVATVSVIDVLGDTGAATADEPPITLGPSPAAPIVEIVDSGVNRVVLAEVTVPIVDTMITACAVVIDDGRLVEAEYTDQVDESTPGTCVFDVPSEVTPGTHDIAVFAFNEFDDYGFDEGTIEIVTPAIGPIALTNRTVSAPVTPAPGVDIAACGFTLTPVGGGSPTPIGGEYDSGTGACNATAPESLSSGDYVIAATVADTNGDTGTATATSQIVERTLPTPPAVVIVDSPENRGVAATVTPAAGETIRSCAIGVRRNGSSGAFEALAASYDPVGGRCTAAIGADRYVTGIYEIEVTATDSTGDTATTRGSKTVSPPQVGAPTLTGVTISVPLQPARGTTIRSCTITLTGARGKTVTLTGVYDPAAGLCRAALPDGFPTGPAAATTRVLDDDGTLVSGSGGIVIPAPTAGQQLTACAGSLKLVLTEVRLDGPRVVLAGAATPDLVGRTISIRFVRTGEIVARAIVGADGLFETTAPPPSRAVRLSNAARYEAFTGSRSSRPLKLSRRSEAISVTQSGDSRVVFIGRVAKPRVRGEKVLIQQLVRCGVYRTVATTPLRGDGGFSASFARPAGQAAAIYRARTRVPSRPGGRAVNDTFTTPTPITFE